VTRPLPRTRRPARPRRRTLLPALLLALLTGAAPPADAAPESPEAIADSLRALHQSGTALGESQLGNRLIERGAITELVELLRAPEEPYQFRLGCAALLARIPRGSEAAAALLEVPDPLTRRVALAAIEASPTDAAVFPLLGLWIFRGEAAAGEQTHLDMETQSTVEQILIQRPTLPELVRRRLAPRYLVEDIKRVLVHLRAAFELDSPGLGLDDSDRGLLSRLRLPLGVNARLLANRLHAQELQSIDQEDPASEAMRVLSDLAPRIQIALCLPWLEDSSPALRRWAAETIGQPDPPYAISYPHLVTMLGDGDSSVRIAAIRGLGELGRTEAIEVLEGHRDAAEPQELEQLDEVLDRLRGVSTSAADQPPSSPWAAWLLALGALLIGAHAGYRRVRSGRPLLPSRRALLHTLAPLALGCGLLALTELGLRLFGYGEAGAREDPFRHHLDLDEYRLFGVKTLDRGRAYHVTNRSKTGWYSYGEFNHQEFPVDKEPGATRLFCLGGSIVYGWPTGGRDAFPRVLQERLDQHHPGAKTRVINCGGVGYDSNQLVLIAKEVLEYQPDALIVFSAHNDFVNYDLNRAFVSRSPWALRLQITLNRIRLYVLMRRWALDTLHGAGWNPGQEVQPSEQPRDHREAAQQHINRRFLTLLDFETNIGRLAQMCRDHGTPLLLLTVPSNLKHPPFQSFHFEHLSAKEAGRWQQHFDEGRRLADESQWQAALEELREAARIDDSRSDLRHQLGVVYSELWRTEEAREEWLAAIDLDVAPQRAHSQANEILRASGGGGVHCVDVAQAFTAAALDRAPDEALFFDAVHPNPAGFEIIAAEIEAALLEQGILSGG